MIKQELYAFCEAFVNDRLGRIQKNIGDIQESLTSETKSSAGDKHETGRAMLQLEREKLGQQLAEAEKMKHILSKVSVENPAKNIGLGSFIKTNAANYYIAISAGECKVNKIAVYCISAATPIARLVLGKSVNDTFNFNGKEIKILSIS